MNDTLFDVGDAPAVRTVPVRAHERRVSGDFSPLPRHRLTDPPTSRAAAIRVKESGVTGRVLAAYREHGPMTPFRCAELLPDALESTVRSAAGRLHRAGFLTPTGVERPSPSGSPSAELRIA